LTDADWLKLLKSGNKVAFNQLIVKYKSVVINTSYRFLLHKEDAEDVSQDVFIEIYQSIPSFRGDAKLSTWIYRITVTKCLDAIKKRNRKKRISSVGKLIHIDTISNWISGGTTADEKIHESDQLKEIFSILNVLPENQRVAYTLSKIEGFTNQEIADIMDTTVIAVESLVYRAKKKVTAKLQELFNKNK